MEWLTLSAMCTAFMVVFLWKTSHHFRYYAKLAYFAFIFCILSGIVMIVCCIWTPRKANNFRYCKWLWNIVFERIPIYKIKHIVRNKERFQSDEPMVIVSNHQSGLDVIALMKYTPVRSTALVKKSLLYTGTYGVGAYLCGAFYVDRSNLKKAAETLNHVVQAIHTKKVSLWMYPEGTRSMKGELQPFKKGAFNIAVQAQVPILPVVFSSYNNFLDGKRKILEPGEIIIQCLEPIPTKGLTLDDVPELADNLRDKMNGVFHKISKEVSIGKEFAAARGQYSD